MTAHWTTKPLGEICDVLDSKRKPVTKSDRKPGPFRYYGATGVLDYVADYIFDEKLVLIGEDGAKWAAGENTAFIAEGQYWVNNHAHVIRPRRSIVLDEWIVYYINANDQAPYITGLTVPKLNQAKLCEIPVPLPPLPEQKRIVAILDEAFAGIAAATANAEKNLANARELFEATLFNILTDNLHDWPRYKLEDMVETSCTLSYGIVQPGEEVAEGLPIVRPTDMSRQVIDLDGLKRIDPALAQGYSRTKLLGGELLLCVRGSTGGISIASSELAGGNVTRGIVPIRFSPSVVSQKLGYYLFLSKHVQDQIREATYGTALMQINIRDLRQLVFIVPPLGDQPALLRELESIASNVQRLKELYEQKLTELTELKQTILQKAFSGELTALPEEALQEEAA